MTKVLRTAAAALTGWSICGLIGLTCGGGCSVSDPPTSPPAASSSSRQSSDGTSSSGSSDSRDGEATPSDDGSLGAESSSVAARPAVKPQFLNVAADAGIQFTFNSDPVPDRYFLPEVMGGGIAWFDFDGDGHYDLFLVNGCPLERPDPAQTKSISRLYRSTGDGRFVDSTWPSSCWQNGFGQGCAVGDFDADGFPDLFVAQYGADVLLRNNGDGTFDNVTVTAGVSDDLWSTSAAWLDADDDGDLDLYVVNYLNVTLANKRICYYDGVPGYCGPGDYQGVPDRLWLNQGDGTFIDGLDSQGLSVPNGKGLAVVIVDFNLDLKPEIYVANDMDANFLFTRGSPPAASVRPVSRSSPWIEVGMEAGCALSNMGLNEASMGISCADFDGDGLPDIYLTHYFNAKNTLYTNLGGLSFSDDSFRSRVAATSFHSLGFGTVPLDFDRDGAMDLFLANGHVLGPRVQPYEMEPQLLWNQGQARFADATSQAGPYFADKWLGRSAAGCDYDNDGDLDIAVSHLLRPSALLRNDTAAPGRFIGFDLRTRNRLPPLGGRVVLHVGDRTLTLPAQAGSSYLASPDPRLLFGLGETNGPIHVEIHWPSGLVQELRDLAADQYWVVYEGESPAAMTSQATKIKMPHARRSTLRVEMDVEIRPAEPTGRSGQPLGEGTFQTACQ